ncbi:MAG: hypothetical protein KUG81_08250 [Gammaproteobacteria bacterium]|nr:hypothetical protein [Gammaproteobacteria bacterium]
MATPTIVRSTAPTETEYTLTYSGAVNGFPSFYSFYPEQIQGMNQSLYTFKEGNMFIHNSDNVDRCTFYGDFTEMNIRSVFNDAPTDAKVFKTIELNSTHTFGYDSFTDLESGNIDSTYFEQKEGDFFAFIRGIDSNPVLELELPLRSSQGIGSSTLVDTTDPANIIITYPSKTIDSIISIGDLLYFLNGGIYTLCGTITSISKKIISGATITSGLTVDSTIGSDAILTGDYTFYIKNAIAESHGLRGYYLEFLIESYETVQSEIFEISSDVFKSYP